MLAALRLLKFVCFFAAPSRAEKLRDKSDFHNHCPKHILNICYLRDPLHISLVPTFKKLSQRAISPPILGLYTKPRRLKLPPKKIKMNIQISSLDFGSSSVIRYLERNLKPVLFQPEIFSSRKTVINFCTKFQKNMEVNSGKTRKLTYSIHACSRYLLTPLSILLQN